MAGVCFKTSNNPVFTVIYPTRRPGGLDLLVESLVNQIDVFELVIIDGFEGRLERGESIRYILDKRIPLRYYGTPSIPPTDISVAGFARAINSGVLWSATSRIVIIQDYCWVPPGWAKQWLKTFDKYKDESVVISGTAFLNQANPPDFYGDITIWSMKPCWFNVLGETKIWKPFYWENCNTYYPTKFFEDVNGLDERGGSEGVGEATMYQLQSLGYRMVVNEYCRIGMIEHHDWGEQGGLWNTTSVRKTTQEPVMKLYDISPNPYGFKELRKLCQFYQK